MVIILISRDSIYYGFKKRLQVLFDGTVSMNQQAAKERTRDRGFLSRLCMVLVSHRECRFF